MRISRDPFSLDSIAGANEQRGPTSPHRIKSTFIKLQYYIAFFKVQGLDDLRSKFGLTKEKVSRVLERETSSVINALDQSE